MKQLLAFLLALLPCVLLAQEDQYHQTLRTELQSRYGLQGGTYVFSLNVATNTTQMAGGSVVTVSGQTFSSARSLAVNTVPANPWNAGISLPTSASIAAGDKLLLIFWARTESVNGVATTADSTLFGVGNFAFEKKSGNFKKDIEFVQRVVGGRWKRYLLPITASEAYAVGGAGLGFQLGFQRQTIQIGGLTLLNYGQTTNVPLPTVSHSEYAGMEDNAPWRVEANQRIEQHRKANLTITVKTDKGHVLPEAQVKIEMLRHAYAFGTAINESLLASFSTTATNTTYQNKLLNLDGKGHGFSEIVFENGHKWRSWESVSDDIKRRRANVVTWFNSQGIRTRGHTLIWPGWSNSPDDLRAKGTAVPPDLAGLTTRMNDRVTQMITYPGLKAVVNEWDVINEPTGNVDIATAFKGTPGYTTGWEVHADIFKKAQAVDPNVKRYINEANITNPYVRNDVYRDIIAKIVEQGGKVDGVGFQAHFRYLIPPVEMYRHYDEFSQLTNGGAIKITEYDNKTFAAKELEGRYLRDLLTITFSHPKSEGFLMWGFWDGAHYGDRAPLFDQSWNLKPEGKPFIDLVFGDWWTATTTQATNSLGRTTLRGFKGDYKITVTKGNKTITDTIRLDTDRVFDYVVQVPNSSSTVEADAYVHSGTSATTNFGTSATLAVRNSGSTTDFDRQAYLRFDLRGISNTQPIARVVLNLNAETVSNPPPASQVRLAILQNTTWIESGNGAITYANSSSYGSGTALTQWSPVVGPNQVELPVSLLQNYRGSLFSLRMDAGPNAGLPEFIFSSKEAVTAANRPSLTLYFDNAIQTNLLLATPVGQESARDFDFTITPNPVTGREIGLTMAHQTVPGVELTNLIGQKIPVLVKSLDSNHLTIQTNKLSPGVYIVSVRNGTGFRSKRIIIQ